MIEEKTIGSGHTLSYGDYESLLVPVAPYLAGFPAAIRPPIPSSPSLLVLSEATLDIGNTEQYTRYLRRLMAN